MNQYYVIRMNDDKWLSAIMNIGCATTENRFDALRIKDINVALSLLSMINMANAKIEEIFFNVKEVNE
jgi:hypothetical protein